MPRGYLVTLGPDAELTLEDGIGGGWALFSTARSLGTGEWAWSGTYFGTDYFNETEPGEYFLATDGNAYFVPDFGQVTTLTGAEVVSAPDVDVAAGVAVASARGTGVAARGRAVFSVSRTTKISSTANNNVTISAAMRKRGDTTLTGSSRKRRRLRRGAPSVRCNWGQPTLATIVALRRVNAKRTFHNPGRCRAGIGYRRF